MVERQTNRRVHKSITPSLSRTVVLHSDFVIRVYKRAFDHLKGDIFLLTVRTRSVREMAEAADHGEQFIAKEFAKVKDDLIKERERVLVLLKDQGLTNKDGSVDLPTYQAKLEERAEYTSPQANEFLKILELMDSALMHIDTLWLHEIIGPKERTERAYQYQRRLIKIANRIRDLGGRCKKKLLQQLENRNRPVDGTGIGTAEGASDVDSTAAESSISGDPVGDSLETDLDEAAADRAFDDVMHSADSDATDVKPNGQRKPRKAAAAAAAT